MRYEVSVLLSFGIKALKLSEEIVSVYGFQREFGPRNVLTKYRDSGTQRASEGTRWVLLKKNLYDDYPSPNIKTFKVMINTGTYSVASN